MVFNELLPTQEALSERLSASVANRHQVEARLSQLSRLTPALQLLQADANQLLSTVAFTHQLANNVSAKVRQLDMAKVTRYLTLVASPRSPNLGPKAEK